MIWFGDLQELMKMQRDIHELRKLLFEERAGSAAFPIAVVMAIAIIAATITYYHWSMSTYSRSSKQEDKPLLTYRGIAALEHFSELDDGQAALRLLIASKIPGYRMLEVKLERAQEIREERERISMERQQEQNKREEEWEKYRENISKMAEENACLRSEQKKHEEEWEKYRENISKMAEENACLRREQDAKILARVMEERQRIEEEAAKVRQAAIEERQRIEEEAAKARQAAIEERQNYPVPPYLSSFLGKINVCVTGPSGVGKSSLINAVCGLDEDSAGAAKTGVTETTLEPTAIWHPKFPQVILWDFPGVGTQNFPQETYIRDMGLKHFACVLLVCATRFTENDRMLLAELERVKLPFFCVRTKFDQDCDNRLKNLNKTQRRAPKMKELPHEIMREMFQEINDDLRYKQSVSSPYIVSALESDIGDFNKLLQDLHAWLHTFAKERPPMLDCSVCRRGEDQSPILFCSKCKNFVCDKCSARLPFCDECPACKCPACYRPVGQQCNADEKA